MWAYAVLASLGVGLSTWAYVSLPIGTSLFPRPIVQRTTEGPYRWLAHPMYVGNVAIVAGMAGMAAGFWNALAIATLAEMVMREWAGRETGGH
jgi:protein-S-isoprenylcysteine O-methyltransferase Ste14